MYATVSAGFSPPSINQYLSVVTKGFVLGKFVDLSRTRCWVSLDGQQQKIMSDKEIVTVYQFYGSSWPQIFAKDFHFYR